MTAPKESLHSRQLRREASARDAAMGRRAKTIAEGRLGPVLKRWINADVVPLADLLKNVADRYLVGDMRTVAACLDTPTAELSGEERPLRPLMYWLLQGSSPGRSEYTTHAEDLALAFLASTITRVATDKEHVSLASLLANAADVLRDTVQGQFICGVQGAKAMQRIREAHPEHWLQRKSLHRICARLHTQVRTQLKDEKAGLIAELPVNGARKVVSVLDYNGELRRLELKPPSPEDWEVMSLCWWDEEDGGSHQYRSLWLALAGMFFAGAQKTGGWFEIATKRSRRKGHTRTTRYVVLGKEAQEAIARDVERWVENGFWAQPMLVPPDGDGDYLSVKHKAVTGQRAPLGLTTHPEDSSAWTIAAKALACSPWTINPHALGILPADKDLSPGDKIRVAEHKRLAAEEAFYLPTCMDFRGRIYYRPPFVTPQSDDMGKALLCFPARQSDPTGYDIRPLAHHMASLDNGSLRKGAAQGLWDVGRRAAGRERGELDRIPIQLDGSCNGLQHLTALTRDHEAAPLVNLVKSSLEDGPGDVYGEAAARADLAMRDLVYDPEAMSWVDRLGQAGLILDRSLVKTSVMVLPYGGTMEAVRKSLKEAVLAQIGHRPGWDIRNRVWTSPWHDYREDNYGAFKSRPLKDHPLFNTDIGQLASLVWKCIAPVIPRAMLMMKALQEIGKWVGPRALAWQAPEYHTGQGLSGGAGPLWVIQAKSKASRKQVTMRGFHLPDMVRRLTLMANLNEIDPQAHKRGIVANFIHSLDAAHLAASISLFKARGGGCVGAIHDCVMVRPSEAELMGRCLREAFVGIYTRNPLSLPVKVGTPGIDEIIWQEFPSWYALALEAGVSFPEPGLWQPYEVLESAWFFS